ncbi:MAG: hypothetical protein JEY96_19555 [Bacteroidales bacterium]|nr:hypothetical protein [Bacteroidales bacterium]
MTNIYSFQIVTDAKQELYDKVSSILNLKPKIHQNKKFNNYNAWEYEVIVDENDKYYDFINEFLDILEPKFKMLEEIGIKRSEITFCYLYEYDNQCNMEFSPKLTKRIGENQITLCISCWDSGKH